MTDRLAEIEARLDAATPGPWERGDVWALAGVKPEMFGSGRCGYCERMGTPAWIGEENINGTLMLAHKHRNPDPYGTDHEISAEDGLVCGNYDIEVGGVINAEDAALIAAAPTDLRDLVAVAKAAIEAAPWVECVGDHETCEQDPCPGCQVRHRLAAALRALANLEGGA